MLRREAGGWFGASWPLPARATQARELPPANPRAKPPQGSPIYLAQPRARPPREPPFKLAFFIRPSYWCDIR
jgi:hypothetical protein